MGMKYRPEEEHPIHHSPFHIVFYKLQQNSKITIKIWNEIWSYL